ncbi:MAG: hypothetical protein KGI04_02460 [Candidatus Micrarchaeota archaeon]|nr:hypothetical protein [Candidatus Micrarchaeota archaeon]
MLLLIGLLFYVSSIIAGVTISNYFLRKLTDEHLVMYAFAFPIGFVVASYLTLAMDALSGAFSSYLMLITSILLLILSYFLYTRAKNRDMFSIGLIGKQYRANRQYYILVFTVVFLLLVLQIKGVNQGAGGIFGGDNYGTDFLFHMSVGNSVVYTPFPPTLLYTPNVTNVFPFITDFFTSMLSYTGIGPVNSLYMTNIPLYYSLVMLSIYLIYVFTRRRYAAVGGFVLFLFCSLWFNAVVLYVTGISLPFFSNAIVQNAAQCGWRCLFELPIFNFSDPLISNFAPQHDYVLGFPYTLILLLFIYIAFFKKRDARGSEPAAKLSVSEFAFAGLLVGLMPLVHPFSMIFVFLFALVGFFYSLYRSGRGFVRVFTGRWLPLGVVAVAVASPLLLYIHGGSLSSTFFMSELADPLWYSQGASIPSLLLVHIEFWFATMGAILALGLIGLYFFRKDLVLFAPAFLALIFINIMRVQPSFGDSNKIALYFLFFMAVSATELLARMAKRGRAFQAAVVILFFIVTLSGFLPEQDMLFSSGYPLAPSIELNATAWILNNTPQNAVFVNNCYGTVFGGISALAHRHAVLEDVDYVSLVGIYQQNPYVTAQRESAFLSSPNCSFVESYNVSYLLLMNLSEFAPQWCAQPNYSAFGASPDFVDVQNFSSSSDRVYIFKAECG